MCFFFHLLNYVDSKGYLHQHLPQFLCGWTCYGWVIESSQSVLLWVCPSWCSLNAPCKLLGCAEEAEVVLTMLPSRPVWKNLDLLGHEFPWLLTFFDSLYSLVSPWLLAQQWQAGSLSADPTPLGLPGYFTARRRSCRRPPPGPSLKLEASDLRGPLNVLIALRFVARCCKSMQVYSNIELQSSCNMVQYVVMICCMHLHASSSSSCFNFWQITKTSLLAGVHFRKGIGYCWN